MESTSFSGFGPVSLEDFIWLDVQQFGAPLLLNGYIDKRYELDPFRQILIAGRDLRSLPLDMLGLASFLYEDEAKTGPLFDIPIEFIRDE